MVRAGRVAPPRGHEPEPEAQASARHKQSAWTVCVRASARSVVAPCKRAPSPPSRARPTAVSRLNEPEHAAFPLRRPVRSFVMRGGRTGPGQQRALATLGPQFVLPFQPTPLNSNVIFGRSAPLILEIGFGMGSATAAIAAARPDLDFIGVEVHEPGVGALLKLIGEMKLTNLRIVQHDAVEVLEQMLVPASLEGVHIFFPDPWHKKRHHKRRLIQPELVAKLITRLALGGTLHCATDWAPYAQQMLEVLSAEPGLINTAAAFAPKPDYRPLTKFEARGQRLGHGVWDLVFKRTT